ncbi:ABC transporter ATP-binding protein [Roseovarius mucosus]|uniref:ABC transporter ATP-binding protein n=1 Tax=Roseovarius mucosus TaxID=215743 RepID=UPI003F71416D
MIELRNVTKTYNSGGRPAVDDVSLQIETGTTVALIGPSGCGKTTTMRMINCLQVPTSGQILVNGQDVTKVDPQVLRRSIGYVIQQVGLFPHMTISENVATVPRLLKHDPAKIQKRVNEMLELVGLDPDEMGPRLPNALSGGQRQRVGFARALAADPEVMLMDEPFGAIDPITRSKVQTEFKEILKKTNKTVVMVTHDLDEALKMGDRVAIMRDGKLLQYDAPIDILARPNSLFVADFLGTDRALKQLNLISVRDRMTPATSTDFPTIAPSASLHFALSEILAQKVEGLIVREDGGPVLGFINRAAVLGPVAITS